MLHDSHLEIQNYRKNNPLKDERVKSSNERKKFFSNPRNRVFLGLAAIGAASVIALGGGHKLHDEYNSYVNNSPESHSTSTLFISEGESEAQAAAKIASAEEKIEKAPVDPADVLADDIVPDNSNVNNPFQPSNVGTEITVSTPDQATKQAVQLVEKSNQ